METLLQFVPYWSFYLRHPSANVLVLTAPAHIVPFLVVVYAIWRWGLRGIGEDLRSGRATYGGVALMVFILLVGIAFATPNASLTLDRDRGTATIRRFFVFWIPYVKQIPLEQVAGAGVQEAPFSTLFYLELTDGTRYHLSSWDAARGQGPGADAVNAFLAETPGTAEYRNERR